MENIQSYWNNSSWIPKDFSEELFKSLDKCKAEWIIESIKIPLARDTFCSNLRIKLKWWEYWYIFYGIGNNPNCSAKLWYDLSWENYPKVWDHFYAIWTYSWGDILKVWKESYEENLNLPDCVRWYNPEEENRDTYDEANKCVVYGKVSWVSKKLDNSDCPFDDVRLEIFNSWSTYYINGTDNARWECIVPTTFPIFGEKWEEYYPKIWDVIYSIVDKNKDYNILKYSLDKWTENYSFCTGNIISIETPSISISKKTDIKTSTPVKILPKVIQERPVIKQNFTWEIVSNSNSGIINLPVTISETNTWWWLIETWNLIASGNLVKTDDIQNEANSGVKIEYQTWVMQEIIPPTPKKVDHSTQIYSVTTVIVMLMIAFVYYFKNYTK